MTKGDKFFIQTIIVILAIPFLLTLVSLSLPIVFGQGTPTTATVQGPLPNLGNLEFEEQKAIIIVEPPDGFQASSGGSQFGSSGNSDLLNNIISALTGGGIGGGISGIYAKIRGDKVEKKTEVVEQKGQVNAAEIVKSREVEHQTAKTMFELAPEEKVKAMEGTAPEIRLEKLADNKEEAISNAAKA